MAEKESQFGFKNFEGYQRAISTVSSRRARYEIVGALNELFFTGESQDKYLKGVALTVYLSLEDRVLGQRTKALARHQSNDQSNDQSNKESKRQSNDQSNEDEERRKKKEESSSDTATATAIPYNAALVDDEIVPEPPGFERFYAHALNAYNGLMGTAYTALPGDARRGLAEAFKAGHTDEDTDSVLSVVASWEPKYRTPNAAFADGKYEQWLFKEGGRDDFSDADEIFG